MNVHKKISNCYVNNINANRNQKISNIAVIMGDNKKSRFNTFSIENSKDRDSVLPAINVKYNSQVKVGTKKSYDKSKSHKLSLMDKEKASEANLTLSQKSKTKTYEEDKVKNNVSIIDNSRNESIIKLTDNANLETETFLIRDNNPINIKQLSKQSSLNDRGEMKTILSPSSRRNSEFKLSENNNCIESKKREGSTTIKTDEPKFRYLKRKEKIVIF